MKTFTSFLILTILYLLNAIQGIEVVDKRNESQSILLKRMKRHVQPQQGYPTGGLNDVPWQSVYYFTLQFAMAMGNNALLENLNDMISYSAGEVSRAYTYGGCGRGGYSSYGGRQSYGYGGYSYQQQPVIYVIEQPTQVVYDTGVFDFTSSFGGTVSNDALLETLITLVQGAIDDSYSYDEE